MSTLAKSGALFALHKEYRGLHWTARAFEIRHRQLRCAIRRQRFAVFLLSCRVFFEPWRLVEKPLPTRALHHVLANGDVVTKSALPVPAAMTIRLRKPELFSILTVRGAQWIVVGSDGFLFCHIVHLKKKLN